MAARTISGTTPYAWPFDGVLDPARIALLVVAPAAGLELPGTPQADRVREIGALLEQRGGVVIKVVTTPPGRPVPQPPSAGRTVRSAGVDGFFGSDLDAVLRAGGHDLLLLAGAGLETCIHSTMRSANDRGYECLLVLDACLPYDDDLVAASASQVEMSGGIFGAVGATTNVLAALGRIHTRQEHL